MKIESAFDIGDTCWCIIGLDGVKPLTIGLVRVEIIDSSGVSANSLFDNYKAQKERKEEYMCIETGIASGNVYTSGLNIFKTKNEAVKAYEEEKNERIRRS